MTVEEFILISHIQGFSPLLATILVAWKLGEKPLYIRWVGIKSLVSVVFHVLIYVFTFVIDAEMNVILGEIHALIEPLLIIFIYTSVNPSKKYARTLYIFYAVFALGDILNMLYLQTDYSTSYGKVVSSLVFIIISVDFFFRMLKELPADKLSAYPMFWINASVLIFFSSTLVLFIVFDYLVTVLNDNMMFYYSFHNIMRTIFALLFAVGAWQDLKPRLRVQTR